MRPRISEGLRPFFGGEKDSACGAAREKHHHAVKRWKRPAGPFTDDGAGCGWFRKKLPGKAHPCGLFFSGPAMAASLPGSAPIRQDGGGERPGKGRITSLGALGPEPLEISAKEFVSLVRSKRRLLKPLLLDQRFLAGVGNIYADEALHRAYLHPGKGLRRWNAGPYSGSTAPCARSCEKPSEPADLRTHFRRRRGSVGDSRNSFRFTAERGKPAGPAAKPSSGKKWGKIDVLLPVASPYRGPHWGRAEEKVALDRGN